MRRGAVLIRCALSAMVAHAPWVTATSADAAASQSPVAAAPSAGTSLPAGTSPPPAASTSPAPSLDSLTWSTDSTQPYRFLAVHGRRSAMFGYSEQGLEAWAYPTQILRSYFPSFRPRDDSSAIDGLTILRRVIYRPDSVTRIYVGPEFVVRERIFVPIDAPGAIVTYEVNGERPVDIVIHFVPVLALRWH